LLISGHGPQKQPHTSKRDARSGYGQEKVRTPALIKKMPDVKGKS
jgi:hypothetical protein